MSKRGALITSLAFLLLTTAVTAQERGTEVSAQITGLFSKETNGRGITQKTTNSAGLLVGYRHRLYRGISAEAVYGYSRDTQQYFQTAGLTRIESSIQQVTGGLVFNLPFASKLRPYFLTEGGALVFVPTKNLFGTVPGVQRDAVGVFVFGGGISHPLIGSHLLMRAEYRGLVYNSPDFGFASLNAKSAAYTNQPSVGLAFRF